jgi:hypothetical protein
MKSLFYFLVLVLPLSIAPPLQAQKFFYSDLLLEGNSEAFPLLDIHRGLDEDFRRGRYSFAIGRAEAGVHWGNTSVGVLARYEMFVNGSKDAMELIWRNEADQAIPADRHWDLALDVNQVSLHGLVIRQQFSVTEGLSFSAALQLLEASHMVDGHLQGHIETFDNDYQGQLHLDYLYTQDKVLKRRTENRQGQGAAAQARPDGRPGEPAGLGRGSDAGPGRAHRLRRGAAGGAVGR